ncbi:MAG TPA: cysteine desulfurase [Acidimicrobiia bacterium]|nr:cysteine desulfurase [Acidimicrobiia bacterium]
MTDLRHLRPDFPIFGREMNGRPLAYLDSAATTQKPVQVLDAVDTFYRTMNANVHRGAYTLSAEATDAYEGARAKVASFINAASPNEVVFSRGATASLNHIAFGWGLNHLSEGDRVVLTVMEHHSNVVPWQLVARHTGIELVYLMLDDHYEIDITGLDDLLDDRVKILAVSGMSNVTGTLGPIHALVDAARSIGALVVVDGAQLVPHAPTDVQDLDADFLVFSGHKMLGPTGIGAMWGKPERLEEMEPAEGGGEMIADVGLYESRWAPVPYKFEAGTPPIAQAVGLGAAVDYLQAVGMESVRDHEHEITGYALDRLTEVPGLTVYGPEDPTRRGGAVSFSLAGIHPHDIATILDQKGIAVRAGHHCAKPLMRHLDVPATTRASFYLYNIPEEVDRLVDGLLEARVVFGLDA